MTDRKTIDTYDKSAEDFAKYFKSIGPRIIDIERGLSFVISKNNIRAVEIGCGDGRDGVEIIKRVDWYQGFDPSKSFLDIAGRSIPKSSLILADDLTYDYPEDLDIVFSFASLLHTNKEDLQKVFKKVHSALKPGGIFYISLKESEQYIQETKKDKFGERVFYYYNPKIIESIAGDLFEKVFEDYQTIGDTKWFNISFKKV